MVTFFRSNDGSTNSNGGSIGAGSGVKVTITGLDAYNGKYIHGYGQLYDSDDLMAANLKSEFFAASTLNWRIGSSGGSDYIDVSGSTGALISNGETALNVWGMYDDLTVRPFTETGFGGIYFIISDSPIFHTGEYWKNIGFAFLTFHDGNGSAELIPGDPCRDDIDY